MLEFKQIYKERIDELEEYLDFLMNLEQEARNGLPRIGAHKITTKQRQVLYSSFYLQIYNTIEATVIKCVEGLIIAINNEELQPAELKTELQCEWVKNKTKPNEALNAKNKLTKSIDLFNELVSQVPISSFSIERGGGGNWDDEQIESLIKRLGWSLRVEQSLYQKIKRPYKDDKGPISYITYVRNNLSHGSISFVECGINVLAEDLRELKCTISEYLSHVTSLFEKVITDKDYKRIAS